MDERDRRGAEQGDEHPPASINQARLPISLPEAPVRALGCRHEANGPSKTPYRQYVSTRTRYSQQTALSSGFRPGGEGFAQAARSAEISTRSASAGTRVVDFATRPEAGQRCRARRTAVLVATRHDALSRNVSQMAAPDQIGELVSLRKASTARRSRMYPCHSVAVRSSIISTTYPPRIRARANWVSTFGSRLPAASASRHRPPGTPRRCLRPLPTA